MRPNLEYLACEHFNGQSPWKYQPVGLNRADFGPSLGGHAWVTEGKDIPGKLDVELDACWTFEGFVHDSPQRARNQEILPNIHVP